MKKVNNFYEKVIAGVIATNVVITPSCVDGYRDSLNLYVIAADQMYHSYHFEMYRL